VRTWTGKSTSSAVVVRTEAADAVRTADTNFLSAPSLGWKSAGGGAGKIFRIPAGPERERTKMSTRAGLLLLHRIGSRTSYTMLAS